MSLCLFDIEKISHFFDNFIEYFITRGLDTKLFEAIITVIIGFITFKIYESYKNRHEYIELFITLKQFEDNIEKRIDYFENLVKEIMRLREYQNIFEASYNNLYCVKDIISDLENIRNLYLWRGEIQIGEDEYDSIEEYRSTPDSLIEYYQYQLAADIELVGYYACSETVRELEELEARSIYKDLEDIQVKYTDYYDNDCRVMNALKRIIVNINRFNKLEQDKKNINLNRFCESIFDNNDEYTAIIKQRECYEMLEKKFTSETDEYIKFDIQFEVDDYKFLVISDYNTYDKINSLMNELSNKIVHPCSLNELQDIIKFLRNDVLNCIKGAVKKSQRKIKRFKWMV